VISPIEMNKKYKNITAIKTGQQEHL